MRPVTQTQVNVGQPPLPVAMDWRSCPFNVGIGCIISGSPTYTVQHSFEDPPTNWFPNANINGAVASADTNYAFPVRYIRLNVTAVSAPTDSVTMTVIQSGPGTGGGQRRLLRRRRRLAGAWFLRLRSGGRCQSPGRRLAARRGVDIAAGRIW